MRVRLGLAAVAVGSLAIGSVAIAQSAQPWSLQASVLGAGQNLNDGLVSGFGFEGQVRYAKGLWSLGLGYQTSKHTAGDESITISGFFLEPRRAFDIGSERMAPYIAGRVAILNQSSELHDPDNPGSQLFHTESSGSAFGAGGGLIIRATSKINIDLGAAFVSQSFSEVRGEGRVFTFSRFTGYVAKGGLSFGFGG
jgi:opacity protein-like surface antigen